MAESMKDFERELEASFKRIDEGDIISGTVVSVDESGVVLDLKFYGWGWGFYSGGGVFPGAGV